MHLRRRYLGLLLPPTPSILSLGCRSQSSKLSDLESPELGPRNLIFKISLSSQLWKALKIPKSNRKDRRRSVEGTKGRGHVGEGIWLSLCILLQQKASTSFPLLFLVFPPAARKNEGKLDGKGFGCSVLRISAFGGSYQVGSDWLFVTLVNYLN